MQNLASLVSIGAVLQITSIIWLVLLTRLLPKLQPDDDTQRSVAFSGPLSEEINFRIVPMTLIVGAFTGIVILAVNYGHLYAPRVKAPMDLALAGMGASGAWGVFILEVVLLVWYRAAWARGRDVWILRKLALATPSLAFSTLTFSNWSYPDFRYSKTTLGAFFATIASLSWYACDDARGVALDPFATSMGALIVVATRIGSQSMRLFTKAHGGTQYLRSIDEIKNHYYSTIEQFGAKMFGLVAMVPGVAMLWTAYEMAEGEFVAQSARGRLVIAWSGLCIGACLACAAHMLSNRRAWQLQIADSQRGAKAHNPGVALSRLLGELGISDSNRKTVERLAATLDNEKYSFTRDILEWFRTDSAMSASADIIGELTRAAAALEKWQRETIEAVRIGDYRDRGWDLENAVEIDRIITRCSRNDWQKIIERLIKDCMIEGSWRAEHEKRRSRRY